MLDAAARSVTRLGEKIDEYAPISLFPVRLTYNNLNN
jgi:hypothetical protein